MSLIAQALVTAQEAEDYCQVQTDEHGIIIEHIINGVSQMIATYSTRAWIQTVYTALALDGNGKPEQYLPNWPVAAIPAPTITLDTVLLVVDTDYHIDLSKGKLIREGGSVWAASIQNLVVTYTAGYEAEDLPADIKLAALIQISAQYRPFLTKSHGDTSSSVQGASVSVAEGGLLPEVKDILELHRAWRY